MELDTILHFTTYFILYSFIGWLLESITKTIEEKQLVNSGFLHGPVCPIYGLGAIIMLLCLSFLKEKPVLLFIASFIILSIWEYVVGIFLEKVFKTKYWDYSHLKFNFQGRLCLKNSIYWGVLGVVFICFVNPFVESYIKMIPINILLYTNIAVIVLIVIDLIVSISTLNTFEAMMRKINEFSENIKDKVKEQKGIKSKAKDKPKVKNVEKTEEAIENLTVDQARLKIRIYRQIVRLKKAFPSMKSETITAFLNQKIDWSKLKEKTKRKNKKKNKE